MRKNGFTLIELLAVIVILAIIALIATPIILGIINDARKESQERSVELYASAVRNGIAAYQLREGKEVAAGTYTSEELPFDVEYDGDVECTTIELYEDGGVYVAGCTVNDLAVEYTYGTKQVAKGTIGICNPLSVATEGTYTAGDKYECDVDPNKEGYDQIFYVLTNATSGSVNLIMDSNITSTGSAIKDTNPTDTGLVAWVSKTDYTSKEIGGTEADYGDYGNWNKGPISAMNHLASATAGWTNTKQQTISTFNDDIGDTYPMGKTYTVNARIPYYSELSNASESPLYLIDYLSNDYEITGRNGVNGIYGYWTLSSYSSGSSYAWYINFAGNLANGSGISSNDSFGVRPVITLSI